MLFTLFIFFFCAVAGQAFNITIGRNILHVSDILSIPESTVTVACNVYCGDATEKIFSCQDEPTCLCSENVVTSLLSCENCMLQFLIIENKPAQDFRTGSNAVMGAYGVACKSEAGITLPNNMTTLTLPKTWDGPFVAILPVGAAAVYTAFGVILGISALYILSNME